MDFFQKQLFQHDVVNPVSPLLTKCFVNLKILNSICLRVWSNLVYRIIFHTYLFLTYWRKLGMYRNSYKSTVPMQALFRHFIMKLNHNLILLRWTAICFVIHMKIISISKKILWMQKPSILLPKQWNSKNTNTNYNSGWLTVFWIQSNIEIKYFLN